MTNTLSAISLVLGLVTPISQSVNEVCEFRDWVWGDGPYKLCFYNCKSGNTEMKAVNSTEECPAVFQRRPNMLLRRN